MPKDNPESKFKASLLRPEKSCEGDDWAFVILPKEVSEKLPRRGRASVDVKMGGKTFRVMLEPDGQKSHWLKINHSLLKTTGKTFGDELSFEISAVDQEPEPEVPDDFQAALNEWPESLVTWDATTTLARVDWIHWIVTAKQAKTRAKRISDACDMLASGKKRVCCFDPSGFYSKAISAPKAAGS